MGCEAWRIMNIFHNILKIFSRKVIFFQYFCTQLIFLHFFFRKSCQFFFVAEIKSIDRDFHIQWSASLLSLSLLPFVPLSLSSLLPLRTHSLPSYQEVSRLPLLSPLFSSLSLFSLSLSLLSLSLSLSHTFSLSLSPSLTCEDILKIWRRSRLPKRK